MDQVPEQLEYCDLPGWSGITWEKDARGLRINVPPVSFWREYWRMLPFMVVAMSIMTAPELYDLYVRWKGPYPSPPELLSKWAWALGILYVVSVGLAAVVTCLFARLSYVIEFNEMELLSTAFLWRFRWRGVWKREAIHGVRRRMWVVIVDGKRRWLGYERRSVIGRGSRAELDWIVRCLQRELHPTPPAAAENT
jgi:hypothetical protein